MYPEKMGVSRDMSSYRKLAKTIINACLRPCGVRLSGIPDSSRSVHGAACYFNTGSRTPLEENSSDLYNAFYADRVALSQYYDVSRLSFYSEVSGFVRDASVAIDGRDVLDVGCGSGHLLMELTRWAKPRSLTGCDFADAARQSFEKYCPTGNFFCHDINSPLPRTFDVVLCTEVLEHIEWPQVGLRNLVNAAKPGGVVVLTVPNGRMDTLCEHINFWSPESWNVFLRAECRDCRVSVEMLLHNRVNAAVIRVGESASGRVSL